VKHSAIEQNHNSGSRLQKSSKRDKYPVIKTPASTQFKCSKTAETLVTKGLIKHNIVSRPAHNSVTHRSKSHSIYDATIVQ